MIKPSRSFYFIPAIIAIVGFTFIIYAFFSLSSKEGTIITEKFSGEKQVTLEKDRYYLLASDDYDFLSARENNQSLTIYYELLKSTEVKLIGDDQIPIYELSSRDRLTVNDYKALGYFDIEVPGDYQLISSDANIDLMITTIGGSSLVGFVLLIVLSTIFTIFGTSLSFIFIYVKRSKSIRNNEIDAILNQQNQVNTNY
jgi:hypothetical protein